MGDAFCAAFETAGAGLAAAVAAQRALYAEDWSAFGEDFPPILVRMGLHTGEVQEREGDYYGRPVNRTARVEAAANGGQVMLTRATYQLVRERLPENTALRELGEHRLKDLRSTEHLYQLVIHDLPDVERAPRTVESLHPRDRVVVNASETWSPDATGELDPTLWEGLASAITSDGAEDVVTLSAVQAAAMARHKPRDVREYRLGRIAEWSQPRYRLDGRFVGLTLLLDQGEEATLGRWQAQGEQAHDMRDVLEGLDSPAAVILGPPGSGKSTLMRRLELDTAIDSLRAEAEGKDPLTFFIHLNTYGPERPGDPLPAPAEWLAKRWAERCPDLPPLDDLLQSGRMMLLLDAFNEIPSANESEYHAVAQLWKAWLQQLVTERPGNRVVFTCRSLDYSQPLSTPALRVPQVQVDSLDDDQVVEFLKLYCPARRREVWRDLRGSPQLEVLRSPYFLSLLADQVEASGELPQGRAALFTGFVRQALRREIERGNTLFQGGELIATRDLRKMTRWKWQNPWDLPERGLLLPKLASLAYQMQEEQADTESSQVRIDLDHAFDLIDDDHDEQIIAAGAALAVLDEDETADELMYVHQLVQEFFAARALAKEPYPSLVAAPWRADEVSPSLAVVMADLDPADPLPTLPPDRLGGDHDAGRGDGAGHQPVFVAGIAEVNLVLAGRCALLPDVREQLPEGLLADLRTRLAERSRDPAADLRERISCGRVAGSLGDPRFERRDGPHGTFLWPAARRHSGRTLPDRRGQPDRASRGASRRGHMLRHEIELEPFRIGQFAVTNAEFRCLRRGRRLRRPAVVGHRARRLLATRRDDQRGQ